MFNLAALHLVRLTLMQYCSSMDSRAYGNTQLAQPQSTLSAYFSCDVVGWIILLVGVVKLVLQSPSTLRASASLRFEITWVIKSKNP
jgi:hypothetical protein